MTEEKLNVLYFLAKRKLTKTIIQLERENNKMIITKPGFKDYSVIDKKIETNNEILKKWKDMLDILNKE